MDVLNRQMLVAVVAWLCSWVFFFTGCGGGGDLGPEPPLPGEPSPLLSDVVLLQPGTRWEYEGTFRMTTTPAQEQGAEGGMGRAPQRNVTPLGLPGRAVLSIVIVNIKTTVEGTVREVVTVGERIAEGEITITPMTRTVSTRVTKGPAHLIGPGTQITALLQFQEGSLFMVGADVEGEAERQTFDPPLPHLPDLFQVGASWRTKDFLVDSLADSLAVISGTEAVTLPKFRKKVRAWRVDQNLSRSLANAKITAKMKTWYSDEQVDGFPLGRVKEWVNLELLFFGAAGQGRKARQQDTLQAVLEFGMTTTLRSLRPPTPLTP